MKNSLIAGIVAAVALLIFAYLALYFMPTFFPGITEEYYKDTFRTGSDHAVFYYLQAIVAAFALLWTWNRFDPVEKAGKWGKAILLGLLYALVAIVPAMLINYSILNVSLSLVLLWLFYGVCQGVLAGLVFAFFSKK